ncbi:LIM domain protein [Cooperia oncophora]
MKGQDRFIASALMNYCGYCERKIEDEPALFARGRLWHVNHLLCDECGCRIQEEEKFEEREGFIICRHCYLNGKNPKCAGKLHNLKILTSCLLEVRRY